jgi:hypothetical protein
MKIKGLDLRTISDSDCSLKGLDGVTYQACLEDISPSGALIKMDKDAPHGLHVGEMCGFMLRNKPNVTLTKHTGRIVSLELNVVKITFSNQEHNHVKKAYNRKVPSELSPIEELP